MLKKTDVLIIINVSFVRKSRPICAVQRRTEVILLEFETNNTIKDEIFLENY